MCPYLYCRIRVFLWWWLLFVWIRNKTGEILSQANNLLIHCKTWILICHWSIQFKFNFWHKKMNFIINSRFLLSKCVNPWFFVVTLSPWHKLRGLEDVPHLTVKPTKGLLFDMLGYSYKVDMTSLQSVD